MKRLACLLLGFCLLPLFGGGKPAPLSPEQFETRVRRDHPRLFLTPETIPALRQRALGVLKPEFDKLLAEVEALPEKPVLEFRTDRCTVEGKKITFKFRIGDQNACSYAVRTTGGSEALKCALAWVVTGREQYRRKALNHIRMNVDFTEYCRESKILYEWFHFTRLNAIVAYDWIASTLSKAERAALMKPMLDHLDFMRKPGFLYNDGGARDGNYGDPALMWYAGVATCRDGFADAQASRLLRDGYRIFTDMMAYRDHISGGSGVLTSICSGYSFGAYPAGSFNFLHTLLSSAGVDGTKYWTQLRDYPNWFLWATIRGPRGLHEYGFGDASHLDNRMPLARIYSHMAQVIHFYGSRAPETAALARAAIAILPEKERRLHSDDLPILPYILTGFDPSAPGEVSLPAGETARYFRNAGLVVMRSGFTPDDTYAAFKAGAKFKMHQHYDENSFVIFRKGFQALDTGSRGSTPHHKVYYPQTVAHNGILIRGGEEPLPNYWYPANAAPLPRDVRNDGGQNRQLAGRNLGFVSTAEYAASAGDATGCYSDRKCREAIRFFVYVKPDYFIVYDRVKTVKPDQEKVFLLHSAGEPETLAPGLFRTCDDGGALFTRTLLPRRSVAEKIGGPGHEFETGGRNYPVDPWCLKQVRDLNYMGAWRLEIKSARPETETCFLHLLQTADRDGGTPVAAELIAGPNQDGVRFRTADGRDVEVRFQRSGKPAGSLVIRRDGRILVSGKLF